MSDEAEQEWGRFLAEIERRIEVTDDEAYAERMRWYREKFRAWDPQRGAELLDEAIVELGLFQ